MKNLCLLPLFLATVLPLSAQEVLSKASNAYTDPGWSFHWNSDHGLGAGDYKPLEATNQTGDVLYTVNGKFPSDVASAEQLFLGTIGSGTNVALMGEIGGLPGAGSEEPASRGVARAAILGYSVPKEGKIELQEGLLSNAQDSVDGVSLDIFINDETEPRLSGNTDPGKGMNLPFHASLGHLNKGDVIYVAIGPRGNNWSDVFTIQYSVVLTKD